MVRRKRDGKMILIIEDERDIGKFLAFRLQQAGFFVEIAGDGKKGLNMIRQMRPDLVLLDLMLPHLPGGEVCKAVREDDDEGIARIPIIMLTANATDVDRIVGKVIGANCYMTKPFDFPDVLENIRKILGTS
jgi:DNA-binding response OmpR family regulator